MCFGGGQQVANAIQKREVKNDPVVISGEQEGLENKKKKNEAADSLKIAKQKETKNFSNPTIATAQKLTQTKRKTLI
jgi:hypothetical protein|tara:strand:+ start:182 stop:412 length:231 start_codon:yes stop_codon:yes gene_type:complete